MCGIVGAISDRNVVPMLLAGLELLEYRGYDSSGLGLMGENGLARIRVKGRVSELASASANATAKAGIAHTRWATHGEPSEANAHPHLGGDSILVVHNGIIENHALIRAQLLTAGYTFTSETDTEVIAHLIHAELQHCGHVLPAIQAALQRLEGAYALGIISQHEPDTLYCVRRGSPLVIGSGFNEYFFASDIAALLPFTQRITHLEEGDIARISREHCQIIDSTGQPVQRLCRTVDLSPESTDLGHYRHFMQKEMFEQPAALASTVERALQLGFHPALFGPQAEALFQGVQHIRILACGSSYHAGLVARYWIEEMTDLPVSVDIASEYRYRLAREPAGTLIVAISQSGETADLLAAVRAARERGQVTVLAICNVQHSSLTREADLLALTYAGIEIGVASTKAFTTQLALLFTLAATLAQQHERLDRHTLQEYQHLLGRLPQFCSDTLALEPEIAKWAHELSHADHALFLGRHLLYPIALEGALKLKEIAYIHAEGYAAGELKHGPLALVDETMPVIVCLRHDRLTDKVLSNLREVEARGGQIYLIAEPGCTEHASFAHRVLTIPASGELAPLLMTLPLQLLAYHNACRKGTDVDKPRNLAKSVTVE
ncbi:glutamine--fructose-6-phosphate transaminase (isomerizing) [Chitinilyticum litopenaei]|uniref:glutamine--fructose-6-phosphate transaminase (isomerizing) n=1 Tax=Chitinilyticum litopenaei TaxID=1121276 RepID=UPI00042225A4|nr:glutamine--fructose-6-phosphate transaminase (isomerizing) [Chitinilyticum litopenaei]